MMALRRSTGTRFGASLVGIALGLQLVFASWSLALFSSAADPADQLAEHALCLAGDSRKARPAEPAQPAHVHDSLCCLAHIPLGLQPSAATTPQPVAYVEIAPAALADAAFIPGAGHTPANARAPPVPA
jgi:hypothetical protein